MLFVIFYINCTHGSISVKGTVFVGLKGGVLDCAGFVKSFGCLDDQWFNKWVEAP